MATTAEDLIVNIKAKVDQAKRDVAAFEKQLEQLDEGVVVPITVKGGRDLDELFTKVSRLGNEDATIVIGIEMARAQRDIKDLLYDISRLDSEDATIDVKVDQIAQARGDLEAMEAKVKELNDTPVDIGRNVSAGGGMERIVDGADQANSAVSNMVGNASQDLGQLTGVTGSAGVALGQLAEYFSDTAFAAKAMGQSMGAAMKSFAMASLPIAGISIALAVITSIAAKAGEMGRKINEASKIAVSSLLDVAEAGGKLGEGLDDVAESAVTKIFDELGSKTPGVVDALDAMGITWDEVVEGFRTGSGDLADMLLLWQRFQIGVSLYGNRQAKLDFAARMGLSKADAEEMLGNLGRINDAFGESFTIQQEANEAATAAGKYRAEASDATVASEEEAAKATEETTAKLDEQREAARQLAEQLSEWAISVMQADGALGELASTFSQMGVRSDALSSLFALGNAPLDAAGQVRDVAQAIDELSEAAKGISGQAIVLGGVDADKALDAIDALRPQIQAKVVEAFSTGGPEAATAMANSYIDQVTEELGGKLSREEVAQLLGLTDIEATVAVALNLSDIENAKRQLAILTGISGETPYTASIALALDAGTITGAQAQTLVQSQLADAGVEIPATLAVPVTADAVAAAKAALAAGEPITLPTAADTSGAATDVEGFTSGDFAAGMLPFEADLDQADTDVEGFTSEQRETEPVKVDANTEAAIGTMVYLKILAALLQPKVTVTADTSAADRAIRDVARDRTATIDVTIRTIEDSVDRWYRLNGT